MIFHFELHGSLRRLSDDPGGTPAEIYKYDTARGDTPCPGLAVAPPQKKSKIRLQAATPAPKQSPRIALSGLPPRATTQSKTPLLRIRTAIAASTTENSHPVSVRRECAQPVLRVVAEIAAQEAIDKLGASVALDLITPRFKPSRDADELDGRRPCICEGSSGLSAGTAKPLSARSDCQSCTNNPRIKQRRRDRLFRDSRRCDMP